MKKTLILGCLAAMSMGYADDTEAHRVSFGADTYYIGHRAYYKNEEINHKSDLIARGVKWSYDYIAPDAFYAGLSGVVQIGNISQHVIYYKFPYMDGDKEMTADLNVKNRYSLEVKQAEGRTGATLRVMPQLTITPFVGLSGRTVRVKSHKPQVFSIDDKFERPTTTTNTFEFLCGAFSEYSYNESFKSGLGVKRYNVIKGRVHDNAGSFSLTDTKGLYEFSLPLSYHFVCNASERFHVSLEPYIRKQFKGGDAARGARLMLACDF